MLPVPAPGNADPRIGVFCRVGPQYIAIVAKQERFLAPGKMTGLCKASGIFAFCNGSAMPPSWVTFGARFRGHRWFCVLGRENRLVPSFEGVPVVQQLPTPPPCFLQYRRASH